MLTTTCTSIYADICSFPWYLPANFHQRHLDAWPQMQATSLIQGETAIFVWFCQLGWYSWWLYKRDGMGSSGSLYKNIKKTWFMRACCDMRANKIRTKRHEVTKKAIPFPSHLSIAIHLCRSGCNGMASLLLQLLRKEWSLEPAQKAAAGDGGVCKWLCQLVAIKRAMQFYCTYVVYVHTVSTHIVKYPSN